MRWFIGVLQAGLGVGLLLAATDLLTVRLYLGSRLPPRRPRLVAPARQRTWLLLAGTVFLVTGSLVLAGVTGW